MKEYANTKKEVENFINTKIIPSLKETYKESSDMISRINTIIFMYSVGRMSALESLLRLTLIDLVGTDNYTKLENYFKEEK